MRFPMLVISVLFVTLGSTASGKAPEQNRSGSNCNPQAPDALVARPSDLNSPPANLSIGTSAKLKLVEAKLVQGTCVHDIVSFVAGNARLSSGKIFLVHNDGTVKLRPPQGIDEVHNAPFPVMSLPGYGLVTSRQIAHRPTENGIRMIYLGIFKSKSDYVIARFDGINGKLSGNVQPLIRATSPISALGFLPAPDTNDGSIGFLQIVGRNKAWLYAYGWEHGPL